MGGQGDDPPQFATASESMMADTAHEWRMAPGYTRLVEEFALPRARTFRRETGYTRA